MLVYCDVYDCKHNEDGMCGNKWPIGTEAIKISENYMGIPYCTDFERIQSDTMASGGMLGKYQPTMTIFGLKNWCGWGDSGKVADYGVEEEEDDPLTKSLKGEAERLNEDEE